MSTILEALRKIQQEERRRQKQGPEAGSEAAPEDSVSPETDVGDESPLSRLVEKASPAGERRRERDAAFVEGARSAEALAERLREADRAVYGDIDERIWEGGDEQELAGGQSLPASAVTHDDLPDDSAQEEAEQLAADEDEQELAAAAAAPRSVPGEVPAELPAFEPSGGRSSATPGNRRTLLLGGVAALLVALLVYSRWPSSDRATVALAPKDSGPSQPAAASGSTGKGGAGAVAGSKRPAEAKHPKAGQHRAGQAERPKAPAGASVPGGARQGPQAATKGAAPAVAPATPPAPAPVPTGRGAASVEAAGATSPPSPVPATSEPAAPAAVGEPAPAAVAAAKSGGGAAPATPPAPGIAPARPEPPFPGTALAKAETRRAGKAASATGARLVRPKAPAADEEGPGVEAGAPSAAGAEPAPSAAEQPQAEPKPTVLLTPPAGAPEVRVVFVQWARTSQKRIVSLRNPSGTLLVLREGDFADPGQGLVVSSIGREWVDFTWKNSTYRVFLNEH